MSVYGALMEHIGSWRIRRHSWQGLGFIIDGLVSEERLTPPDYVNDILLTPEHRSAFLALVDREGLVVCKNVGGNDALHKDVRGRSSRGRLSQGEYYHHDGCSGPVKPRVVEIRCPYQPTERHVATAVAAFPELLVAMVRALPNHLCLDAELQTVHARIMAGECFSGEAAHTAQGILNRSLRRRLSAEAARAYFREVDLAAGAYREPWALGESRFIANNNSGKTMQHRRAYLDPHSDSRPNGRLLKRWPDGPFEEEDLCLRAVA